MLVFEVVTFCLAVVCLALSWIPATVFIGDCWLAPLLERYGKRHWYLSGPHRAFWYSTMILPFIGGIVLMAFSPGILSTHPWLLIASIVTLIVYGAIGLFRQGFMIRPRWYDVLIWPLNYIF